MPRPYYRPELNRLQAKALTSFLEYALLNKKDATEEQRLYVIRFIQKISEREFVEEMLERTRPFEPPDETKPLSDESWQALLEYQKSKLTTTDGQDT
jgi:hypothetical protein